MHAPPPALSALAWVLSAVMADSWNDDAVGDEELEDQFMEDEPEVSPATLNFSDTSTE